MFFNNLKQYIHRLQTDESLPQNIIPYFDFNLILFFSLLNLTFEGVKHLFIVCEL